MTLKTGNFNEENIEDNDEMLKEVIEKEYEEQKTKKRGRPKKEKDNDIGFERDTFIQILANISNIPYSLLSEYLQYDFSLNEQEQYINSTLLSIIIEKYIDRLDSGKIALYGYIFFNLSLISLKFINYKKEMKSKKEDNKEDKNEWR